METRKGSLDYINFVSLNNVYFVLFDAMFMFSDSQAIIKSGRG